VAETPVIEVVGLHKAYGGVEALRGLDLQVPAGSICGFLGRNGSGKTTTIKVLLGMARATSGTVRVFGADPFDATSGVDIRRRTGFVSDDKDLLDEMTVDALIRFTSTFFPAWRRDLEDRYVKGFELPRGRRVKELSRGTRTRLAVLLALSRGAGLLVFDEPTANLDPAATEDVLQALVSHAAAEGVTVLFSTHQIAEVEQIADRVVMIEQGRTVLAGALDDVREQHYRVQMVFDGDAPLTTFRSPAVVRSRRDGRVASALARGDRDAVLAEAAAFNPVSVEVVPVTLKDLFLETVKGE
jgi:ABC-2 type transport system ATP-binding protein